MKQSLTMPKKKLNWSTLLDFSTSIWLENSKTVEGGTIWWKKIEKKSHSVEKKSKGGTLWSRPRFCVLRGKPFWFSSYDQQVQFGVFSKFCRTFGKTILVTSGGLKKHYRKAMTRILRKAPTKKTCQVHEKIISFFVHACQQINHTAVKFSISAHPSYRNRTELQALQQMRAT